jgi:hypothetical protein
MTQAVRPSNLSRGVYDTEASLEPFRQTMQRFSSSRLLTGIRPFGALEPRHSQNTPPPAIFYRYYLTLHVKSRKHFTVALQYACAPTNDFTARSCKTSGSAIFCLVPLTIDAPTFLELDGRMTMKRRTFVYVVIGQFILLLSSTSAQTISNSRDKAGNLTSRSSAPTFTSQPNNEQGQIRNAPPANQNITPTVNNSGSRKQGQRQ